MLAVCRQIRPMQDSKDSLYQSIYNMSWAGYVVLLTIPSCMKWDSYIEDRYILLINLSIVLLEHLINLSIVLVEHLINLSIVLVEHLINLSIVLLEQRTNLSIVLLDFLTNLSTVFLEQLTNLSIVLLEHLTLSSWQFQGTNIYFLPFEWVV